MFHVMMVCTGNICRSPMAAGLLAHYLPVDLKKRVQVSSAGTHAMHGHKAQEHAIATMAQIGIDITAHRARQLTREMARSADLILTMEAAHLSWVKRTLGWRQAKPRLLMEFDHQSPTTDIYDPYGDPLAAYQRCLQTLRPCIKGVILWIGNNT
jgi:protein-tyrosine-phosphatase